MSCVLCFGSEPKSPYTRLLLFRERKPNLITHSAYANVVLVLVAAYLSSIDGGGSFRGWRDTQHKNVQKVLRFRVAEEEGIALFSRW